MEKNCRYQFYPCVLIFDYETAVPNELDADWFTMTSSDHLGCLLASSARTRVAWRGKVGLTDTS